ncbi:MAG: AEC family transporter [Gemmiger sp.]
MSFSVLIQQTSLVFLMMALGFAAHKCGVLTTEGSRMLSNLVATFILPLNILSSAGVNAEGDLLRQVLQGMALLLVCYFAEILLCNGIARAAHLTRGKRAVLVNVAVFPNSIFIGLPFCVALFGEWSTIYAASAIVSYNVLFFTYGVSLFRQNETFRLKSLLTPVNLATAGSILLLATGWHMPALIQDLCKTVGSTSTPLALMIVGVMVAENDLREIFRKKFLYGITLLRNVIFPLILLLALAVLRFEKTMATCILILGSTASGTMAAVIARQTDTEPQLAGQAVVQTTLFLAVTLPPLLMLANLVL